MMVSVGSHILTDILITALLFFFSSHKLNKNMPKNKWLFFFYRISKYFLFTGK